MKKIFYYVITVLSCTTLLSACVAQGDIGVTGETDKFFELKDLGGLNAFEYVSESSPVRLVFDPSEGGFFLEHEGSGMIQCGVEHPRCWVVDGYVLISGENINFRGPYQNNVKVTSFGNTKFLQNDKAWNADVVLTELHSKRAVLYLHKTEGLLAFFLLPDKNSNAYELIGHLYVAHGNALFSSIQ